MNTKKTKSIADMLPKTLKENLSPESLSVLTEEFERLVESRVNERLAVATAAAEASFDEEANKKCTELVMKIEEAHKLGLEKVVNHLNEKHDKQISNLKKFYNNHLGKEALKFKNKLVESVSNYITSRVDRLIPYKSVRAAVKNDSAMKVLESFKSILNVNEISSKKEISKAILEGKKMIDKANRTSSYYLDKLKESNKKLNKMASHYAFEKNLSRLDENTKNFVTRFAKRSGVEYANKNMEYLCNLHEKKVAEDRKQLAIKEMNDSKRKKLGSINRRVLVEKTTPKQLPSALTESRAIDSLITAIEKDINY